MLDIPWPDLAPQSASSQLYKAVYHVRQAFEKVGPECAPDELTQMGNEILYEYVAEDAEAIREHARCGGFPVDRIIQVHTMIDPTTAE